MPFLIYILFTRYCTKKWLLLQCNLFHILCLSGYRISYRLVQHNFVNSYDGSLIFLFYRGIRAFYGSFQKSAWARRFGLRTSEFCHSEKGLIWDQKVDLGLVPNAQDACAATAFFDPSISELYAGKTMVASLFPVRALAMDKRFCHVKNIMKKYRKTLLHAFSKLRAVVLHCMQKCHIFLSYPDDCIQFVASSLLHPVLWIWLRNLSVQQINDTVMYKFCLRKNLNLTIYLHLKDYKLRL